MKRFITALTITSAVTSLVPVMAPLASADVLSGSSAPAYHDFKVNFKLDNGEILDMTNSCQWESRDYQLKDGSLSAGPLQSNPRTAYDNAGSPHLITNMQALVMDKAPNPGEQWAFGSLSAAQTQQLLAGRSQENLKVSCTPTADQQAKVDPSASWEVSLNGKFSGGDQSTYTYDYVLPRSKHNVKASWSVPGLNNNLLGLLQSPPLKDQDGKSYNLNETLPWGDYTVDTTKLQERYPFVRDIKVPDTVTVGYKGDTTFNITASPMTQMSSITAYGSDGGPLSAMVYYTPTSIPGVPASMLPQLAYTAKSGDSISLPKGLWKAEVKADGYASTTVTVNGPDQEVELARAAGFVEVRGVEGASFNFQRGNENIKSQVGKKITLTEGIWKVTSVDTPRGFLPIEPVEVSVKTDQTTTIDLVNPDDPSLHQLTGEVKDKDSKPVPFASLFLDTGNEMFADKDGKFSFPIEPGARTIKVKALGVDLDVQVDSDTNIGVISPSTPYGTTNPSHPRGLVKFISKPGVALGLYQPGSTTPLATTTTGDSGYGEFRDVYAGQYIISPVAPTPGLDAVQVEIKDVSVNYVKDLGNLQKESTLNPTVKDSGSSKTGIIVGVVLLLLAALGAAFASQMALPVM